MSSPPSNLLYIKKPTSPSPRVKPFPKSSSISVPFVYNPSDDGTDENLLILLHGLGDTHTPFGKLGRQLKLPQTATLALRAPEQIPYLYEDAYQWYQSFDDLGDVIPHPNPTQGVEHLMKVIKHLIADCAWLPGRIHLFGFAQGGSVAVECAVAFWKAQLQLQQAHGSSKAQSPNHALGSVVSVCGGPLLHHALSVQCPTPVLVLHRAPPSELVLSADALAGLHRFFEWVKDVRLGASGGMPRSREEWHPVMEFWSQRLGKRAAEGLYEVLSGIQGNQA